MIENHHEGVVHQNLGPLQEQQLLVTAKTSPVPPHFTRKIEREEQNLSVGKAHEVTGMLILQQEVRPSGKVLAEPNKTDLTYGLTQSPLPRAHSA